MDRAYQDNNISLMREMLKKGAYLPDSKIYEFVQKPINVVKFMLDNGHEIRNKKELFTQLMIYSPPNTYEKMKLFFDKGLFPTNDEQLIVAIMSEVTADMKRRDILSMFTKERSRVNADKLNAYKYFLSKTKKYFNLYHPAYAFYGAPIMKEIINEYGGINFNQCVYEMGDMFRTYYTDDEDLKFSLLQRAAYASQDLELVKYFISKNADVNFVCSGNTALDYVRKLNSTEQKMIDIELFLLSKGAKQANELKGFAPAAAPPASGASSVQADVQASVQAAEKTYTNSIGMEFVLIPAGSFIMGSSGDSDARPHKVTISKPFYLGKFEVTQAQWTVLGSRNNSQFKAPSNPVEKVSWNDIQKFIQRLNQKEGHTLYRLPTEAEWEYAARAGSTSAYYFFGDDAGQLGQYAWYNENSGTMTHPVGQKQPNAWGLYDILGNVQEWVQDYYGVIPATSVIDPHGPAPGPHRVVRGGNFGTVARSCLVTSRSYLSPDDRYNSKGFRLVLSPE
ncbi:MAG: formylglycine-generating enzyme family protein [Deltaproteobacteria bacterium]|nr:formylglycine-generating enzyme family protein [Deltaproteobacteria bacterium]